MQVCAHACVEGARNGHPGCGQAPGIARDAQGIEGNQGPRPEQLQPDRHDGRCEGAAPVRGR